MDRKKLLLVFPKSFAFSYGDMQFIPYLMKQAGLMNVSLPTLAAMTPADFEVEIVDENLAPLRTDRPVDLVGITGFHTQLLRAEEIARTFRARGVPVVCGGPSASISPERWRPFSDVLVIGEAERTWPRFLADFLAGTHQDEYREDGPVDLSTTPVPDYGPIPRAVRRMYFGGIVQTSRGCPFDCEFCDVIVYVGRKIRYKPVDKILEEVEQIHRLGKKFVVLADDNFSAGRDQAKAILEALGAWNRRLRSPVSFVTQLSIDIAGDEEFLRLAAGAGLNRVLIGVESPDDESLREVHKLQNVRSDLLADVRKFHAHGIVVLGTSIVGFDNDDLSIFRRHLDFFNDAGCLSPQPFPLQAPDGTPLKERMIEEGRYRGWNPEVETERANNFNTFTFTPKKMTVEELQSGLLWLIRELYRPEAVVKRFETFCETFEASAVRESLGILSSRLDRQGLGILLRTLKYCFTRAPREERSAFRRLLGLARRSSHPQRFMLALTVFLNARNVREMLERLCDDVEAIRHP